MSRTCCSCAARLVVAGVALGLASALIMAGSIRGLLFEVQPLDPASMIASALLLGSISMLASYIPARRAARLDPIATLRTS